MFDYNYLHASMVKQIDQWLAIPPSNNQQGAIWPTTLFVQTIISLHCLISSLRLGLIVHSFEDWVIPLVNLLYRGNMGIITV